MTTEEKIEQMKKDIEEKFGISTNIFKAGGMWSVKPENWRNVNGKKMKEIREYIISRSGELEDDDV